MPATRRVAKASRRKANRQKPRTGRKAKRGGNGRFNGGYAVASVPRQTVRSANPRNLAMAGKMGLHRTCCALSNPFDPGCVGCRFPDGNNGRSLPFQMKWLDGFQVDAGGRLLIGYMGAATKCEYQATYNTPTTGKWNFPAAYTGPVFPAIIAANISQYRIVCWGLRVSCTSSVPNTSGQMIISTVNIPTALSDASRTPGAMDDTEVEVVPLATGATYTWISKRTGPATYQQPATSTVLWPGIGTAPWTSVLIEVTNGVGNLTNISVEVVMNLEVQFPTNSGFGHLAPPDPPPNPTAVAAVSKIDRVRPSVISGPPDAVQAKIESFASKALSYGAEKLSEVALEGVSALFGL